MSPAPIPMFVCIHNYGPRIRRIFSRIAFPSKGAIYTIRDKFEAPDYAGEMTSTVILHEIHNPTVRYRDGLFREAGFAFAYFRPVRPTDISLLRNVLIPLKETDHVS